MNRFGVRSNNSTGSVAISNDAHTEKTPPVSTGLTG